MQEFFRRWLYGCRHVGDDTDRTRLRHQPIYRQVPQPDGDVGKIPQRLVQEHSAHIVPVSPRADGRRRRSKIFGKFAKDNNVNMK